MKKIVTSFVILILLGVCSSEIAFAQADTTFLDKDQQPIADRNMATYMRICPKNINGKIVGKDIYCWLDGKIEHFDRYDSLGRYRESAYFKADGSPSDMTAPAFEGGREAQNRFILDNLKYPKEASDLDIEGKVFVQFRIDKNGAVANVEVLKSPHESLSVEALRMVSIMPRWKPATRDGSPVVSPNIYLPISFKN